MRDAVLPDDPDPPAADADLNAGSDLYDELFAYITGESDELSVPED
jgi:hypothetical protein